VSVLKETTTEETTMETRNRLSSNTNEGMAEDGDVQPQRLSSNTNEDAASDDD
jgi:hypothetical protein